MIYIPMFPVVFFWFKRVLDWGPEQRESKMTVLCPLIITILISYIIIYYIINYGEPSQPKLEKELNVSCCVLHHNE
jgi:hypothetical protein